ncbi:MAG: hypothetical protein ACE5EC_02490 [Phycisphaerae bacterium]
MKSSLIIAGGGLLVLTMGAIALRRQRERAARSALAARHGWTIPPYGRLSWSDRLGEVGPCRIGHGRRLGTVFRTRDGIWLFSYVCDTGFEHRRGRHAWRLAVCERSHGCGRASMTRDDWFIAMMTTPDSHTLSLAGDEASERRSNGRGVEGQVEWHPNGPVALVEDREEWRARLDAGLGAWFRAQPRKRSWQVLPGLIVGFEPGPFLEDCMEALAEATRQLAEGLLETGN